MADFSKKSSLTPRTPPHGFVQSTVVINPTPLEYQVLQDNSNLAQPAEMDFQIVETKNSKRPRSPENEENTKQPKLPPSSKASELNPRMDLTIYIKGRECNIATEIRNHPQAMTKQLNEACGGAADLKKCKITGERIRIMCDNTIQRDKLLVLTSLAGKL